MNKKITYLDMVMAFGLSPMQLKRIALLIHGEDQEVKGGRGRNRKFTEYEAFQIWSCGILLKEHRRTMKEIKNFVKRFKTVLSMNNQKEDV